MDIRVPVHRRVPAPPTFDVSGEVRLRIGMTVIGFHCSHEQIDPATLAPEREEARA